MIGLIVTINIKPEHKAAFMASLEGDGRGSNTDEPGCLQFDVLQDTEDDNRIFLYEIYRDEAALEAHRNAPHFLKWREEVKDWFASEISRHIATPVYPKAADWVKRPRVS